MTNTQRIETKASRRRHCNNGRILSCYLEVSQPRRIVTAVLRLTNTLTYLLTNLYVSGVNYKVNSNYRKYLTQLCGRFLLRFGKFPSQICDTTYPPNV